MAKTKLDATRSYVAVDLETTGFDLKYCEIIEASAIRVNDGQIVEEFESLVKPSSLPLSDGIIELTGITNEDLSGAPSATEVIPKLASFIGDDEVVGHNVTFDARFLDKYYQQYLSGGGFNNELIDTLRVSRHVYPEMKSRKLPLLVKQCAKDGAANFESGQEAHRALSDAKSAAFCYEVMRPKLVSLYGPNPDKAVSSKRPASHVKRKFKVKPTVDEFDETNPFFDSTVCFTGTLAMMTRDEAVQVAANLGAEAKDNVIKKLDYLIVGSFEPNSILKGKPSDKLKKALMYNEEGCNISIVSEDFFYQFIES